MTQPSYDYATRTGVRPISWLDFFALCKGLAAAVASYQPQVILAVGRGGCYPGALIAHLLQADIYPVRLSRRVGDVVRYRRPRWLVRPPKQVIHGQRVLVVDEISSTGETLMMVRQEAEKKGAAETRCVVLYAHTAGAAAADYIGLISDELLLNPWDREIFRGGAFIMHPEYAAALADLGIEASPALLIDAQPVRPAKEL